MKKLLLFLLLCINTLVQAQTTIDISAGISDFTHHGIPEYGFDDTWKVYRPNSTTAITPVVLNSVSGWPSSACARWISPSTYKESIGDYIYETFFRIPCPASNPSLELDVYACDNTFVEISINNHVIPFITGNSDDISLHYNYVVSNLAPYITSGNNRLRIIVHNRSVSGTYSPTWTGLFICGQINTNYPYSNDPAFTLSTPQASTLDYFYRAATPVVTNANLVPGFGEMYIIERMSLDEQTVYSVTSQGNNPNPPCWWTYPVAMSFRGYNGSQNVSNLSPCKLNGIGRFPQCFKYRITRGTWNNYCPWAQYSVMTVGDTCNVNPLAKTITDVQAPDFSYMKPAVSQPQSTAIQNKAATGLISPNPGSGIFKIKTAGLEATRLEVYNQAGAMVKQAILLKNSTVSGIDLSDQTAGIYTFRIISNTGIYTEKILLTR